jgi:nickel-dependent lactate racemase
MNLISVEYGESRIRVELPVPCDELGMGAAVPLPDPAAAIQAALQTPLGALSLRELARGRAGSEGRAVIVVSDNTRPVPYRGAQGILAPLLRTLLQAGFTEQRITVLIGTGSHRRMSPPEIEAMLGLAEAGFRVPVENHVYDREENLVLVGRTRRGSPVKINKLYMEADLKIVTGLVESHFMAGASGGRKGICPAVAGKETLRIFHGPEVIGSPLSADLVFEGNPCHEEAEEAAELAGCDFAVNVTLDSVRRLTGVFCGDIRESHRAAVSRIREYVVVALKKRYDLVIIPGGFVSINHYQATKAAMEATRALRPGGMVVLIARHRDVDPVGSADYKRTLAMLVEQGSAVYLRTITSPSWQFVHDQWETQIWGRILEVLGSPRNLVYCSLEIPREEYRFLPCRPGIDLLSEAERGWSRSPEELMQLMAGRAVHVAVEELAARLGRSPEVLFLRDGPYGIPELTPTAKETS